MNSIQKTPHRLEIMLVDDDEQEISTITRALSSANKPIHLQVMRTGEAALNYLHPHEGQKPHLLPELILIEVDHTGCHGFEVLEDVKTHLDFSSIPVVLLTEQDHGVLPSYFGGTCHIVCKPLDQERLLDVLESDSPN